MTVSESVGIAMLAERARQGEAQALDHLSRRLYPTMEKWLRGMIRERHADVLHDLTAEIAQETWAQLQRKIFQFKGDTEAAFMAWCYRVTFATCKNYLKKYVRVQHREEATDSLPEQATDLPGRNSDATTSPRDLLIRDEKLKQVREAVMSIKNERHREAIILFFFEEMPQKEIAETLGATESAVSTWVYRGKKEIEQYLNAIGFQG